MTDYTKLVAAVRDTDFGDTCVYCEHSDMCKDADCIILQAADAIEDLQAEVEELKAKKMKLAENSLRFVGKVRELDKRRLEPKRGEWKETDMGWDGDTAWVCSVCGEPWTLIDGTPKENNMNFCPNCGVDMREES